jgi:c-di-GMP-binding flagellar brake protein YcgR
MPTDTHSQPIAPKLHGVRRHRRFLFSVPVELHHLVAERKNTTHGMSLEISEGGMSAVIEGDLRIGEIADVAVPLPAGDLKALAIVRHKTAGHFGFEFLGLRPEERQRLKESTRALLPQDGTILGRLGL